MKVILRCKLFQYTAKMRCIKIIYAASTDGFTYDFFNSIIDIKILKKKSLLALKGKKSNLKAVVLLTITPIKDYF